MYQSQQEGVAGGTVEVWAELALALALAPTLSTSDTFFNRNNYVESHAFKLASQGAQLSWSSWNWNHLVGVFILVSVHLQVCRDLTVVV